MKILAFLTDPPVVSAILHLDRAALVRAPPSKHYLPIQGRSASPARCARLDPDRPRHGLDGVAETHLSRGPDRDRDANTVTDEASHPAQRAPTTPSPRSVASRPARNGGGPVMPSLQGRTKSWCRNGNGRVIQRTLVPPKGKVGRALAGGEVKDGGAGPKGRFPGAVSGRREGIEPGACPDGRGEAEAGCDRTLDLVLGSRSQNTVGFSPGIGSGGIGVPRYNRVSSVRVRSWACHVAVRPGRIPIPHLPRLNARGLARPPSTK
jgi:hypothetical protein